jgi:NADPH:quinone reductase-like Zn-dependent oxidoreductase
LTALQALRDVARIGAGQSVLINGASGGVGTFAVQIARHFGARVTAVCSTRHVWLMRALGADRIVDYTREDFSSSGERHDAIIDLVGNRSLADCRLALGPKGTYVACSGAPGGDWLGPLVWMLGVLATDLFVNQKLTPFLTKVRSEDLAVLAELAQAGAVAPVIERRFGFARTAEAVAHVADGHAQGKTVILM